MTTEQLMRQLEARGLLKLFGEVALKHHATVCQILSAERTKTVTRARKEICERLRCAPYLMSYPEIGRLIGRDHTSVMNLTRDDGGAPRKPGPNDVAPHVAPRVMPEATRKMRRTKPNLQTVEGVLSALDAAIEELRVA